MREGPSLLLPNFCAELLHKNADFLHIWLYKNLMCAKYFLLEGGRKLDCVKYRRKLNKFQSLKIVFSKKTWLVISIYSFIMDFTLFFWLFSTNQPIICKNLVFNFL